MAARGPLIAALLPSWQLALEDQGLSAKTVAAYLRTGELLAAWLAANGHPAGTESVDAPHIRAFLAAERDRTSAASAHHHYRNLRVLFGWLAKEDERQAPNPMDRVEPPKVTRKVKAILPEAELAGLLKACAGTSFEDRRDLAIIRIFIDTGLRVSGMAGMLMEGVDLPRRIIKVRLKGGDEHLIPLGRRAAAALDRYLRLRARSRHAESPWLWLGTTGRDVGHFGTAGIQDMLERRAEQCGIPHLTPHMFRRTFAHDWLAAGGSELDAMGIAGWRTRDMLALYAGDLAAERARDAHKRLSPGDRL